MTQIHFTVPGVPVAQPRPRATPTPDGRARIHEVTHVGKGATRRPHPIAAFKATIRLASEPLFCGGPLDGPVRLDVTFVMPRPSRLVWKKRPMPRVWHTSLKDRDNLDKAVMDALKGLAFRDDKQVCDGRILKVIAAGDEQPHVEITLTSIADESCPQPEV